ncbi:tyrosine-type recombinase/integrase [Maritimibacter sp. DP07]|uniref:Tyrosine-type recombinase/integrase n=1 Tax=Maritimibacter harenae TaxID=2606218 RepID=A0A845M1N2_9RHOB|nr:integrase arm-type DNA-binding domain-containing protein [Maritimibacter harenae]MZR14270.1 tyrosine-type recombinase/integrase [Maritimibacter harenae]
MPLTDAAVKAAQPGPKLRKLSDGEGLQLHIQPTGSKLWRLAYRFQGKQKTLALGKYPDVSLKAARLAKGVARATLASGLDPMAERRTAEAPQGATWRDVASEYVQLQRDRDRAPKTIAKLESQLSRADKAFGSKPVRDIKASDVLAMLRGIEAEGKHVTAAGTRSACSRVFRYAVATDRAEVDPSAALIGALVGVQSKGYPAIVAPEEVGGLIRAIRDYPGDPTTRVGLKLCAYTFLRPGEVTGLRWADIDWESRQINIPGERMKLPRPHVVPMSVQVESFLREVLPISGRNKHVLSSLHATHRPLSNNTLNAALRRLGYSKEEMVAHGFRKTASTLLNEAGFNKDWIERQLAHAETNAVRAAYDKSEHIAGRTKMMQTYADMLDELAERQTKK